MAVTKFKTTGRKQRIVYPEGNFSKGMQYSESFLDRNTSKLLVNYTVMDSGSYITPRKGVYSVDKLVRTIPKTDSRKFPAPHATYYGTYFSQTGEDVHGFIVVSFGVPTSPDYEYYFTVPGADYYNQTMGGGVGFVGLYINDDEFVAVNTTGCNFNARCTFFKTEPKPVYTVHDSELYFINNGKISKLLIEWDDTALEYVARIEEVVGKEVNLTEATTIGFNMFDDDPYAFESDYTGIVLSVKGVLPYASDELTLKLSANLGETLVFKTYYTGVSGASYKYKWEMAYFGSTTYTVLEDYSDDRIVTEDLPTIKLSFIPSVSKFILRCTIVPLNASTGEMEDILAKVAIYPVYELGITELLDVKQSDNWDLGTAKGMCEHAGMMVLWGVKGVEKTIFISDGGDVEYFPFPNNTYTVPEEILKVVSFSGSILIFTARKLYYIEGTKLFEMYGPYTLMDNVDFEPDDIACIMPVNTGLLVRMNGMLYILARNSYTGKIGDSKMVNISVPILDILFDFPKFIHLLSDRLYKFDVTWGETTRIVQYDFVNVVVSGKIKNIFRFAVYEELDGVLKRFQIDVIGVYDTYSGIWTFETASFPYTGIIDSGSSLYSSYVKIGADVIDVYIEQLLFKSTECVDTYNSMFYGDAVNDHSDTGVEEYYQTLSASSLYRIKRVVDGDTVILEGGFGEATRDITVRFNFINTPESTTEVQPYGVEASSFLKTLLPVGSLVIVDFDSNTSLTRSDRYGRMLGWLFTTRTDDGAYFKDQLIQTLVAERGYVQSYYDYGCVDHTAVVEAAVATAITSKLGLYANLMPDGPYYLRTAQSNDIVGNFQIFDSGNRDQDAFMEKKYKEVQFMMSNDSPNVLRFYLEFYAESVLRQGYRSYHIDQVTDAASEDYGTIYVTEDETETFALGNESALSYWELDFSAFPDLEVVKVVCQINGRGHYPKVVLISRNQANYRILDYAWVFRTMNGR